MKALFNLIATGALTALVFTSLSLQAQTLNDRVGNIRGSAPSDRVGNEVPSLGQNAQAGNGGPSVLKKIEKPVLSDRVGNLAPPKSSGPAGNVSPFAPQLVSPQNIEKIVKEIHWPLKFALNLFKNRIERSLFEAEKHFVESKTKVDRESYWRSVRFDGVILKVLFPTDQSRSIFAKLDSLKIVPTSDSCFTENPVTKRPEEADASAYGAKKNETCLSTTRIAKKVVVQTMFQEVLALAAHELVHRMGFAKEEIPEYVQSYLRTDISAQAYGYKWKESSVLRSFAETVKFLDVVINTVNTGEEYEKCMILSGFAGNMYLYDESMQFQEMGMEIIPDFKKLRLVIEKKKNNLELACAGPHLGTAANEWITLQNGIFGGRPSISVADLIGSETYGDPFYNQFSVAHVTTKDWSTVTSELQGIKEIFTNMARQLPPVLDPRAFK